MKHNTNFIIKGAGRKMKLRIGTLNNEVTVYYGMKIKGQKNAYV